MKLTLRVGAPGKSEHLWRYSGDKFLIGRDPECPLAFKGEIAELVSWRHAEMELTAQGPIVTDHNSTNGVYVNGNRIKTSTLLHVGDSVWLGQGGPRIKIVEFAADETAGAAVPAKVASPNAAQSSGDSKPAAAQPVGASSAMPANPSLAWVTRFGAIVLLGGAIFVAGRFAREPAPPAEPKAAAPASSPDDKSQSQQAAKQEAPSPEEKPVKPVDVDKVADGKNPGAPAKPLPIDPWQTVHDRVRPSVALVAMEDTEIGRTWAQATAVRVSEKTFLTAADAAILLANHERRGRRISIVGASLDERFAVEKILVRAGAQQPSPEKALYYDLGLLITKDSPPGKPIELAAAAELSALEEGVALAGVAFDFTSDSLNRQQRFEPQLTGCKVFLRSSLPGEQASPRLLHLRGQFVQNPLGCPIVNEQGHLVGVYADASAPADGAANPLQVHYAPVIEPELIELGTSGAGAKHWIEPVLAKEAAK